MHKDPPKERYILGSFKCVNKELSQLICRCLKLVQKQMKLSCAKERINSKSRVNKFWIVKDTDEVVKMIERVNDMK